MNYISILALLLSIIFFSCKKKDLPKPQNQTPFKASFKIFEPFYGTTVAYSTDTVINDRVAFETEEDYDSYSWRVGYDPTIRRTRSFTLRLPADVVGQTLTVTLIASKKGAYDTVTKSFTVMVAKGTIAERFVGPAVAIPYLGTFKGSYEDAPNHKFPVSIINFDEGDNSRNFAGFRVLNLPEGCGGKYVSGQPCILTNITSLYYSYPFQYTYKAFYVDEGDEIGCCPTIKMFGYLDPVNRDKIVIECFFLASSRDPTVINKKIFIGYRN